LKGFPVFDGHVDTIQKVLDDGADLDAGVPGGQVDFDRLEEGGVRILCFACWVSPDYLPDRCFERAVSLLEAVHDLAARHPRRMAVAKTMAEAEGIAGSGRLAAVLGVEGGHAIEGDPGKLERFAELGVRYMTLTWNNHLPWAESCRERTAGAPVGLTAFGRKVVERMAGLGIAADLSHASPRTFADVLEMDVPPPLCSHSASSSVHEHCRNLSDGQIEALAARGGVVGLTFVPGFLASSGKADLRTVLRHAERILSVGGERVLGIGSDFDGIERGPEDLEDCSRIPCLLEALRLGEEAEYLVASRNLMRVLEAWEV